MTKLGSGWFESFEHQVDHRYVNPGLAGFGQFLVVFAEPPAPAQPGQCALHHPPAAGSTSKWWLSGLRRTTCSSHPPVAQAHAISLPA